jgi:SanA protein
MQKYKIVTNNEKTIIKRKKKLLLTILFVFLIVVIFCVTAIFLMNWVVYKTYKPYICQIEKAPLTQTAIVLGCLVYYDGTPCDMLIDRVKTGVNLYKTGKVKKILLTGDHGRTNYDEVNSMRRLTQKLGVPPQDIFMDHAGFNTYESMYRARDVFKVKSALIVTQDFHLDRALYIARKLGIEAYGISADRAQYWEIQYNWQREIPARVKAFIWVNITHPLPKFLGPVIPIEGDGRATRD